MTVRSERERKRAERLRSHEFALALLKMMPQQSNDCADGRHHYGNESIIFKGQRACRCGAVEGENPN